MLVPDDRDVQLSVVIVLWNCETFLARCLESLERSSVPLEIHCVDNGSSDESADVAEQLGCRVDRAGQNLGFPKAVNRALAHCRGPVTLLLNPDVELAPDSLERALEALTAPGVGMVGANLRRPDGTPDPPAARRFRTVGSILVESLGLPLVWPRLDLQYLPGWDRTTERDVPCINGAFMLLPTATLREVGGLDETVFLYLEDQELCRAVTERGERIRFVSGARATHVGGGSTEAGTDGQRAAAYLHRLDASLEIVRRRQGNLARLAALVVLGGRSASQLALAMATGRADRQLKHRTALRWLAHQVGGRHPPPAVP